MNRNCAINEIRDKVIEAYGVGKTSASLLKPNKILLPTGSEKLKTKDQTNEWAKRVKKDLDNEYQAKYFGSIVNIDNNTNINGTIVDITIPTRLIDAYERKYSKQTSMFSLDNNKVNYQLKVIKALESDKVRKPKASIIQGFYNDLIKQGVTNQQLDLIKDIYKDGMTKDELIANLLGSVSYTVEINTAKVPLGSIAENEERIDGAIEGENTKTYDYLSARNFENKSKYKKEDGWEYAELDITTPLISPSIESHAGFANKKNSIGWARVWYNKKTGVVEIQEVQSDLFQKGRDKSNLINKLGAGDMISAAEYNSDWITDENSKWFNIPYEQFVKTLDELDAKNSKNQFLQLLNKDNNWVTFFIKAIIQDTAKQTITEVQQEDVEAKVRELEKEGLLEIDCKGKLKAEKGLTTSFTKGGTWKVIKDLKGYPTHKEGGVDLTIGKDGVSIKNGNTQFTAKYGLVIPKN